MQSGCRSCPWTRRCCSTWPRPPVTWCRASQPSARPRAAASGWSRRSSTRWWPARCSRRPGTARSPSRAWPAPWRALCSRRFPTPPPANRSSGTGWTPPAPGCCARRSPTCTTTLTSTSRSPNWPRRPGPRGRPSTWPSANTCRPLPRHTWSGSGWTEHTAIWSTSTRRRRASSRWPGCGALCPWSTSGGATGRSTGRPPRPPSRAPRRGRWPASQAVSRPAVRWARSAASRPASQPTALYRPARAGRVCGNSRPNSVSTASVCRWSSGTSSDP